MPHTAHPTASVMPLPAFAPLSSDRLTIRPLQEADIGELLGVNGDPEVTQFLPYNTWQSRADGLAWFERMSAMGQAGTAQQLVLELTGQQKIIGTLLFFHHDEKSARGELGFVLGRRYWGQGLMSEALQAFCTQAFGAAGLRRLEAEVNPANKASNVLLQRLGFTNEGTLRKRWVTKGEAYDTHLYGLLVDEWQTRGRMGARPAGSEKRLPPAVGADQAQANTNASVALVSLLVHDYDEAITFFTDALQFRLIEDTPLVEGKRWVVMAPPGHSGASLLLAKAASPDQRARIGNQTGGRVFLFLRTDDFWASYHHMLARGVRFAEAPRQEIYGPVVVFYDLCGNRWDLLQQR